MILAAGRGERMRPLTDHCPKPLLKVAGIPLIEHHITKLAAAGFKHIVINHAWLGQKIEEALGHGDRWGVEISYSREGDQALETAGGIIKALPILGENDDCFLVVNGDVYSDYAFTQKVELSPDVLAHLWLVPNPEHNLKGDFELNGSLVSPIDGSKEASSYTFSGIAVYHKRFFEQEKLLNRSSGIAPLGPLLRSFSALNKISGEVLTDKWVDVGTPERLRSLNEDVRTF